MEKIKVLIVDDSAVIRQLIKDILETDREIEVVGVAADAHFAEVKIEKLRPDVITLDVEMPGMDGITFLDKIMKTNPLPVVMISSHTDRHAVETLRALELGAVDFVAKPKVNIATGLDSLKEEIIVKVKAAARAKIRKKAASLSVPPRVSVDSVLPLNPASSRANTSAGTGEKVIVLGASTGGTVAISNLLEIMPVDSPGIAIVQHMPEKFTRAFADRIDSLVAFNVKEAEDGDRLLRGTVLIAPGGKHMLLQCDGKGFYVQIKDGPPVNRHKPSVDVLFRSAANSAGKRAIGIMLTGMGNDGAKAMLELKRAGSFNIAQSEESCVVFGMPKAAIDVGAVDKVASIDQMPAIIFRLDKADR